MSQKYDIDKESWLTLAFFLICLSPTWFTPLPLYEKFDSTLEKHKELYVFQDWLKSLPFIVVGWDPWIKKTVNYLSCIDVKVGLKDIDCIAQNTALFVDTDYNWIFYENSK